MEARVNRRPLFLLLALTVLLRLPFLNQAIQGDDHIYLTEGEHALIDPLHPNNVKYVFLGDEVDLRGHSHPPGNGWVLGALLWIFGDVKEAAFHAAYIGFSLIAVWSVWSIAQKFTEHPVWATLLFVAVPAFLVNGNSLEADLPFLAFFLLALARKNWVLSVLSLIAATMMAYQGMFLVPILAVYLWLFERRNWRAWALLLVPVATFSGWQIFTRATTGAMPASQLAGYLSSYGFQTIASQVRGSVMLLIHSWFLVFPALVPLAAIAAWRRRKEPGTMFLAAWIGIFLICGFPVFFAGSARYLLPIAAPVAILASRLQPRWLAVGFAAQLGLGLAMTAANYQHWDGYRTFAASLTPPAAGHRIWVDNDWGLRYYLEARGALPARKDRVVRPGDLVVTSELGSNVHYSAPLVPVGSREIRPWIPLRLIGLESHSGYSTVSRGFWPFGVSDGAADRVHAWMVRERRPTLEFVSPKSPEAKEQFVSGIDADDGWTAKTAILEVKEPASPKTLVADIYVPDNAKARKVTLVLDGKEVASRALPGPGRFTVESATPLRGTTIEIHLDETFRAPGDQRDLGVVLLGAGFR